MTAVGVDDETCRIFGKERGRLRKAGKSIADFDLLIGATALRHGLTLLTNNSRHFSRIQGLRLESIR
ncbi:MAG: type II toxin-antitoxin system VapC family toxin [Candidatus Binatia bacterium]